MFVWFSTAQATVAIDPTTGGAYGVTWFDGLGQIDSIDGSASDDWSIFAATDSVMSMASVVDCCVVGDAFALLVDGVTTAWTSSYYDAAGYFHGESVDLFFSAGAHTISLALTDLALKSDGSVWLDGYADATFSGLTSVPEASSLGLLFLGLAGIGFTRKKKSA